MPESLFNKVYRSRKRLCHRCFPVNFAKLLRTPFLQYTSGGCSYYVTWISLSIGLISQTRIENIVTLINFYQSTILYHSKTQLAILNIHFAEINFCEPPNNCAIAKIYRHNVQSAIIILFAFTFLCYCRCALCLALVLAIQYSRSSPLEVFCRKFPKNSQSEDSL